MLSYIKIALIAVVTLFFSSLALLVIVDRSFTLYFILDRLHGKIILWLAGVKLRITGHENVEKDKLYVYASNHMSLFDIPVLQAAMPQKVYKIYKKELGKIPIFGWQLLIGPYISVDRKNFEKAMNSIKRAERLMEKKRISMLLFPEGTRSRTGEVQPFKRGAFFLAAKVKKPIIPVSISGTDKIMPKKKFRIMPGEVHIHFGKPLDTGHLESRQDEIDLMNKVREIVINNRTDNNGGD